MDEIDALLEQPKRRCGNKECGKYFLLTRKNRRFCCDACRNEHNNRIMREALAEHKRRMADDTEG